MDREIEKLLLEPYRAEGVIEKIDPREGGGFTYFVRLPPINGKDIAVFITSEEETTGFSVGDKVWVVTDAEQNASMGQIA